MRTCAFAKAVAPRSACDPAGGGRCGARFKARRCRAEDRKSALRGSLARHGHGRDANLPRNRRPADAEAGLGSDRGLHVLERSGPS
jgi:hypothetical protein